jgi:hypothetical protein
MHRLDHDQNHESLGSYRDIEFKFDRVVSLLRGFYVSKIHKSGGL